MGQKLYRLSPLVSHTETVTEGVTMHPMCELGEPDRNISRGAYSVTKSASTALARCNHLKYNIIEYISMWSLKRRGQLRVSAASHHFSISDEIRHEGAFGLVAWRWFRTDQNRSTRTIKWGLDTRILLMINSFQYPMFVKNHCQEDLIMEHECDLDMKKRSDDVRSENELQWHIFIINPPKTFASVESQSIDVFPFLRISPFRDLQA